MNKKKKTGIIGIIILVVIVILSNLEINSFSSIGSALGTIVMPIQNLFAGMSGGDNNDLQSLKEENEALKTENSKLKQEVIELDVIRTENETLNTYLNLKNKYADYNTIPGNVISKDTSNFSNVVIINKGSNDGVKEGLPVIADEGLVGHVISVTETTAKVETLLDTSSAVSSLAGTSKDSLIVKGTLDNPTLLRGTTIPTTATLLVGDRVETSGLGGIYPKGILIGNIKEIVDTKNLSNRYVLIEPAVSLNKLNSILVITY